MRLPEGDIPAPAGAGVSKSAVSRRFVALSAAQMKQWMATDLSQLDLLVIQIDGIHMENDLVLLAAVGIDGDGVKHPLGVLEGATENSGGGAGTAGQPGRARSRSEQSAVCSSSTDSKALRRRSDGRFGKHTPIQRCQMHKARNIMERSPSICMRRCGGRCVRRGNWMMP